jgi:hypothetical protein
MRAVIGDLLNNLTNNNENFQGFNHAGQLGGVSNNKRPTWVIILSVILVEIVLLIFGKFLWNNIAIKLIPGISKIKSIWQILGLSILIKLLTN